MTIKIVDWESKASKCHVLARIEIHSQVTKFYLNIVALLMSGLLSYHILLYYYPYCFAR